MAIVEGQAIVRVMRMIAATILLISAAAQAESPDLAAARRAYIEGRWEEAASEAAAADGAEASTLAAAAELARLMTQTPGMNREAAAERARDHAEAALEDDPDSSAAHLRMAAALGYQGRYASRIGAYMRGLPQRGREHIETAIRLDPDDPWGHAMLGAWHLEVVRRGAGSMLGASLEEGLARYSAAVRMAENEPGIPYHFALALIALDPDEYAGRAEALLERAVSAEPGDAFAEAMIAQARSLLALLQENPRAAQEEAEHRLEW